MKWLDNSFWGSYYPLIILLIIGYPIYRVFRNEEDSFKTKIIYVLLIIFLPLIGSIVYLLIDIRKRFRQ
jgi:predicted membrane metal-binding protein